MTICESSYRLKLHVRTSKGLYWKKRRQSSYSGREMHSHISMIIFILWLPISVKHKLSGVLNEELTAWIWASPKMPDLAKLLKLKPTSAFLTKAIIKGSSNSPTLCFNHVTTSCALGLCICWQLFGTLWCWLPGDKVGDSWLAVRTMT